MLKRALTALYVLTTVCAALFASTLTVRAQAEPTAIIDAAFQNLSTKLGTSLSRATTHYGWELIKFGDTSLGCGLPGVSYPPVITEGYKITITVNGVDYDYRANKDGSRLFQCAATVAPTAIPGTPTATPIPAPPTAYNNPIAFIDANGNVHVTQLGSGAGTLITNDARGASTTDYPYYKPVHYYNFLRWSPDGVNLAFVDSQALTLYVARSGQAPQIVAHGIVTTFPPFWLPNGQEVGFAVPAGTGNAGDSTVKYQIQAIAVSGGSPRVLGEFNHFTYCGGGGLGMADGLYFTEGGGYLGHGLILQNTLSGGYLYSPNCSGIGLGFTPGTSGGWQRPDLGRAVLSPDGTQLIALKLDAKNIQNPPISLEKVNLADGTSTSLAVQSGIDQIGWADNSTILYSTVTAPISLKITISDAAMQAALPNLGALIANLTKYTVNLWKMPAAGGDSMQVRTTSARGIGAIMASPDGANAIFSEVSSMESLVNALNAGQTAPAIYQAIPAVHIVVVALNGQKAVELAAGGHLAVGRGTFSAVPAVAALATVSTNNQPNLGPPALVIGGKAVVSVTGDALNLRQNPTKSASVVRLLKQGVVVTVVAGPVTADGLRWWQVRLDDNTTGWAADQITDGTGTTNTLTPQ